MESRTIIVRGAREHNLRNVNLELPRNKLICFTGVSGSGKSSLAFDTLYAEGQRRYVESLSSYARQFLGRLPKPDVDYIGGLSPAVSIQQKTASRNPRSTVGTITEVSDFLRVLYARLGQGYCPQCKRPITAQTREQIIGRILALPEGTRFLLLAPVVRGQKGEFKDFFADMVKRGYVRARVDGAVVKMTDNLALDRRIKHDIAIVIDRLKVEPRIRPRLAEAVEQALTLAEGNVIIAVETPTEKEGVSAYDDLLLSAHYACVHCAISYEPPTPQLFSFNSPQGMCPECDGLGTCYSFDPDLLIPDPSKSFAAGAIPLVGSLKSMGRWRRHIYEGIAKTLRIDLKRPWRDLPEAHRQALLLGSGDQAIVYEWKQRGGSIWRHTGKWEGIVPQLLSSFKKAAAGPRRAQLEKYMRVVRCSACNGQRLNPQARNVRINGRTLIEVGAMPIGEVVPWLDDLAAQLDPVQKTIAAELLKEIRERLGFLLNVGLHYLTLDRAAPTLSGGEAQRIRLAGQIGSGLVGVLYILDEPSIGLHPRDNERLLRSLERLRDMGNTVLVVEHDEETMRASDYVVDFGPGPGVRGGEIVAAGTPAEVLADPKSLTGQYLSGRRTIPVPEKRRACNGKALRIVGARHHNLKNISVDIPLGVFVAVTGVSGSGKSSLINEVLRYGLREALGARNRANEHKEDDENDEAPDDSCLRPDFDRIEGVEHIDKFIDIDQSPIGRTPRSNPATYIKLWDEIRTLFTMLPEAKVRGYDRGRFSFNRPGGRCEACEGNGANRLEMDFLADVWVTCPVCEGKRFNQETLQVRYKGKNIHDILHMDVQEALELFENVPKIRAMLQTLHDVGLDYVKLGQPSPTLSGGEAQRVKLAKQLARKGTGKTLYILDEPTTGLHFEDIRKLLEVLHGFVEAGNTVLVIEHNQDVIKTADWLIDLGPEGGIDGGTIVATGTPEQVTAVPASYTGKALLPVLKPAQPSKKPRRKKAKSERPREREPLTHIHVVKAHQHNLKDVTVAIPREAMTVCCGPSGSGKSTLALDTIYAEGQRRYVESLSSYARQFLGQVQKPKVEQITGLSPAIAIEQKTTSKSPRSTVGTITEIYDYLRVLYARLGQNWCPKCNLAIGTQTVDEITARVLALPEGTKLYLMAPVERRGQERWEALWDEIRRAGFQRVRIDGKSYGIDDVPSIDHRRKHQVEVIVDRNIVRPGTRARIAESVEVALSLARGVMHIALVDAEKEEPQWKVERYSQHLACMSCGTSYETLNPHHFSFNSPLGWCPTCEGLGVQRGANIGLLVRDERLSLRAGALAAWPDLEQNKQFARLAEALAKHVGLSLDTPFRDLEPSRRRAVLHGTGDAWIPLPDDGATPTLFQYKGLYPAIDEAARVSFWYRARLGDMVEEIPCSTCRGTRLRSDAAAMRFNGRTIGELCDLPIGRTLAFFKDLDLTPQQQQIAGEVLREIRNRLQFLVDVGLDYLTLSRSGPTLSGGEAQRIRLASQIGSGLTGVLYVLDEPTIGLHPRDNARLLQALRNLRDLGNTLLLVEHDREVIAAADYLLDFGPGAGDRGGTITAAGAPAKVLTNKASLTGRYLSNREAIAVPTNRRLPADLQPGATGYHWLSVIGARRHNLRHVDAHFPLGALVAVTGVSGSGKSSLVHEVLYNTLARKLHRARTSAAAHEEIRGIEHIDKIINVDQAPIGNAPSSNPATYTGVFDLMRQLFARLPESKIRGYTPRRFSFNQKGGRCEACEGNGQKKIEMHFLPDVWIECDVCKGSRFTPETLAVQYKGKSIADVLKMRIGEARELFDNIPKIRVILQTLCDVGLDYLSLGQAAPTLSGGEAQRVKLAAELARPSTGKTLYILDEPTTGLHFDDVRKLLDVLQRLVDLGNTVIVVEHNLDVIKSADWLIDIGPEAGIGGGSIVAQGTPETVVDQAKQARESGGPISHTGLILAATLAAGPHAERMRYDPKAAAAARIGDVAIEQVGKDAKLPWEADGRRWHTVERVTTKGEAVRWDGAILTRLDEEIHKCGEFAETDWSRRTIVEIAAPQKSKGWFFHAHTGMPHLVRLVFRTARNTFKQADLHHRLGLKPTEETPGLEGLNRESRVEVANRKGPWQEVSILAHTLAEIDTPAFREFLTKAIAAFGGTLQRMASNIEDVMPWKRNGEAWHLGDKGFPPGSKRRWDAALLPQVLALLREIEPTLEVKWDNPSFISLKLAGVSKAWAHFRTKEREELVLRFLGRRGELNLAAVEGIGHEPELVAERADGGEVLILKFRSADDWDREKLKGVLQKHAAGFRRAFGG